MSTGLIQTRRGKWTLLLQGMEQSPMGERCRGENIDLRLLMFRQGFEYNFYFHDSWTSVIF